MSNRSFGLGGYFSRLLSYVIDNIILYIISILIEILLFFQLAMPIPIVPAIGEHILSTIAMFIGVIYFTFFFGKGATPGMRIMNLELIKESGVSPTYLTGFVRYIGMLVSAFVFFLGYIWILIDGSNQGWHDKLAGTYIVKEKK